MRQHAPAEEPLRSAVLSRATREISIMTQLGLAALLLAAEPRPVVFQLPGSLSARLVCASLRGSVAPPGRVQHRPLPAEACSLRGLGPTHPLFQWFGRAWRLCAFVLVFDALRGILGRLFFLLHRITGFHLLNLCSPYSLLQSRVLFAPPGHRAPRHRIPVF